MIVIDLHSRIPIYEQIKEQVILLVQMGIYQPDEQLPSIRSLASELNLNVNTVKRAFQELERDGITYSMPGRGIYINKGAFNNQKVKDDALLSLETALLSAKNKGVHKKDLLLLIKQIYGEDEKFD